MLTGTLQSRSRQSYVKYISLAAGASIDLDSDVLSEPGKIKQVIISSAVPVKADIKTVIGASETTYATFFIFPERGASISENIICPAGGKFRVTVTNLEDMTASDVYVTFVWDDV